MAENERWSAWLSNGRLASAVAGLFFVAWLVAQIFWPEGRQFPTEFTVLVMGMVGSAFGNVMLKQTKKTAETEKKVTTLEMQMAVEQKRNTNLEQATQVEPPPGTPPEAQPDPKGRHHA